MAIVAPDLSRLYGNIRLDADARQMAAVLRLARQEAISSATDKNVVFYTESTKYKYDSTYYFNPGIAYIGTTTFTTSYAGKPACVFKPSGVPGCGGTVTIANNRGEKRYIIVNPAAGRIRVSKKPPANW